MNKIRSLHVGQLFFHPNSIEPSTQIIKPKLKLLLGSFTQLNIYIFIPGTSKSYTSRNISSFQLNYYDWELIINKFKRMLQKTGYYSLDKCCDHKYAEVWNDFTYVAKLKQFKFLEIIMMCEKTTQYASKFDRRGTILARIAVTPLTEVADTISKLGI